MVVIEWCWSIGVVEYILYLCTVMLLCDPSGSFSSHLGFYRTDGRLHNIWDLSCTDPDYYGSRIGSSQANPGEEMRDC